MYALSADEDFADLGKDITFTLNFSDFIAYGSYIDPSRIKNLELFRSRGNFVIPATGGEPEPILVTMKDAVLSLDWDDKAYAVEPANALVTTWGALKTRKTASSMWR